MKIRIILLSAAIALSLFFVPQKTQAEKQVIKVEEVTRCRNKCDAIAKACALDGKVSLANCVFAKDICRQKCDNPAS